MIVEKDVILFGSRISQPNYSVDQIIRLDHYSVKLVFG